MMDFIRSNVFAAKSSSEIELEKAQESNLKVWLNSLEPEEKLVWVYERLGFDNNWRYLQTLYEEDPEKYLKMMEVVKNWKF